MPRTSVKEETADISESVSGSGIRIRYQNQISEPDQPQVPADQGVSEQKHDGGPC